jgi:alkaline phosphatase/alkaline phosphatase D
MPNDHPAQTDFELHRKWHEQFRFPRLTNFFRNCPAYWLKDDHDFRFDDADQSGDKAPCAKSGRDLFREQMPIFPAGDLETPTYRTRRVHPNLQLWLMEGRDYRSDNKQPDGPDKSLWGVQQRRWLERTLKESGASWKIIISPTPMVGPDRQNKRDNHADPEGFRNEAEGFFRWLNQEGMGNVLIFCGDRHWQYHSIHPLGIEEFSVGALNDENSIAGVKAGTPASTDPQGLIKQPYLYGEPTGGFLHVTTSGTSGQRNLTLAFHDDHGKLLHQVVRKDP